MQCYNDPSKIPKILALKVLMPKKCEPCNPCATICKPKIHRATSRSSLMTDSSSENKGFTGRAIDYFQRGSSSSGISNSSSQTCLTEASKTPLPLNCNVLVPSKSSSRIPSMSRRVNDCGCGCACIYCSGQSQNLCQAPSTEPCGQADPCTSSRKTLGEFTFDELRGVIQDLVTQKISNSGQNFYHQTVSNDQQNFCYPSSEDINRPLYSFDPMAYQNVRNLSYISPNGSGPVLRLIRYLMDQIKVKLYDFDLIMFMIIKFDLITVNHAYSHVYL